uniref:beta-ketoacyl-[acyl-carrier-protein] synthase I n=1 Tax=Kalanchoe fedtschenkoi TaxID=63787 RepID=A0A7N0V9T1_KALFE
MPASTITSPFCTWLMAACMSSSPASSDYDLPSTNSMLSSKPTTRNRRLLAKCAPADYRSRASTSTIAALCGSSFQGLISSFEPCHEFTGIGIPSLFRSKSATSNRKQRRAAALHSGKTMAVALQPAEEVANKKKPFTKQRRVVVTGLGVVSPVGHEPDVFYNNLLEGVSGISEIETFDCTQFPTRIAGEIKEFSTDGWVAPKLSKRMDKFMLYLMTAGKKALVDGGLTGDVMGKLDKTQCGVLIGSAMGGMKVFYDAIVALRVSYKKMNPFCVPFATTNMGSAMLAMDLGWMGPNYSISTACATSNFCILNAANHIIRGEADVMLSGGSDAAVIPIGLGGFVAFRALSQRNADPTRASRPWDSNRDGFVMGEGAGVLLLEELEHAKNRGADIYAEFLGGSFTSDAYHITEPHPEGVGVTLCIENALEDSGVSREDVNYINAHATSTPAGDIKEFQALMRCFGQNSELRVNSTKSMIGHLLGAAGAVEAIATVQAIRTGWVHPNINLEDPDECVDTNVLVGAKKERLEIKAALSNSFGFGGHNSSIIFAPYK